MTQQFEAYLEIGETGACMARILTLPGCFVRAKSDVDALAQLPDTIRWYEVWLYRWLLIWPDHEREHAHDLRLELGM